MWGQELTCMEDVFEVFKCYISGENNKAGVKVINLIIIYSTSQGGKI